MMVSMPATPSSFPTGAFAEGTKARKKASPCHAPQKIDHDDPQKAGKNVALNANCLGRRCTQNSDVRRMFRRFSSAVAVSREDDRSRRSDLEGQRQQWGLERLPKHEI
jgi:hypothetical protein